MNINAVLINSVKYIESGRVSVYFKGKKILVIGGTGTIGRNIINHLFLQKPNLIKVFSRDEYRQYLLENELSDKGNIQFVLGDIRDYRRVEEAMHDIDYVFHLAAMKHVPACEMNPFEAVLTNLIGTNNVIKAAIHNHVKKVIYTSSDKAIAPTNTYGATKLIAERIISATQATEGGETIIASVRFGNVMGSRGSVIPLFKNQIINNRKITVTDLEMSRFMMTIDQATFLTLKALQEAKGGEVFVLKMPVVILKDLVRAVIEETCDKYGIDINEVNIEKIGLRSGEKMHEELMTSIESTFALELPNMFIIPGKNKIGHEYHYFKPAQEGAYSSSNQTPLSVAEIRNLIKSENLI